MTTTTDGSIAPFAAAGEGEWLRCALHNHTTASDGMLDAFMLRRYYTLGGFDVLAITDHDMLTPAPDREDRGPTALVLPGTEISLRAPVSGGPLHLLALGIRAMPRVERGATIDVAVAAVSEQGGLAVLAHPWWSGLLPEELGALPGVAAVEVYNGGCEIEQGRGYSGEYWEAQLARGVRLNAIATDDHHLPGFNAFQGWTMVRARERTVEGVVAALRDGHCYASCGPVIHDVRFEAGALVVECSPVVSIAALTQPPYGQQVNAGVHGLTELGERRRLPGGLLEGARDDDLLSWARFPALPGARYLRVQVTDAFGNRAWTNPIWLDR